MKTNLLMEGSATGSFSGMGGVTRKMLRERAVELAISNGRDAPDVWKSDWEQAKLEMTSESEIDP